MKNSMNKRSLVATGVVVFLVYEAMDIVIHGLLLARAYDATSSVWRPEPIRWIMPIVAMIWSLMFTYIFGWIRHASGVSIGIRYGFCVGLLTTVPTAYVRYAILPIPHELALGWFVLGMIRITVCGIVLSVIYRPQISDSDQ